VRVIQQLFESKSINMVQQMEFRSNIQSVNESQGENEADQTIALSAKLCHF